MVYTYDALNRLASAQATSNSWGQSYGYDGFGNLSDQNVIAGSAPALHVVYNAATNRQTGDCADANGNLGSASSCTGTTTNYDVENRMISPNTANQWQYSYAPGNKRVWRGVWTSGTLTTDEVTFWGVDGQRVGTWQLSWYTGSSPAQLYGTMTGCNYYFGGKLIKNAGGYVSADRLGSIGKFYPYGQEKPSATTNGTEKFTGYVRDAETGLDYADQRYEQPGVGRFMTPDRSGVSARPSGPGSWNRYAYTRGDPINRVDPNGTVDCPPGIAYCYVMTVTSGSSLMDLNSILFWAPMAPNANAAMNIATLIQNLIAEAQKKAREFVPPPGRMLTDDEKDSYKFAARDAALKALTDNSACSGLFKSDDSGAPDPASVLTSLVSGGAYGTITYGELPFSTAAQGTPGDNKVDFVLNNSTTGLWALETAGERAATLIHELGHAYQIIWGDSTTDIKNDSIRATGSAAASLAASIANEQLVEARCNLH